MAPPVLPTVEILDNKWPGQELLPASGTEAVARDGRRGGIGGQRREWVELNQRKMGKCKSRQARGMLAGGQC